MAIQLGTGHIHSLSGGTLSCSAAILGGYVSPNMQSLRCSHKAEVNKIKSASGRTTGLIGEDDMVECSFEVIPEGTTIANAKKAAGVPAALTGFGITGLPIVAFGGFSDVLNTDGTNTQPWIYEQGGQLNGAGDDKWTLTLPLSRYLLITSATPVS